MDRPVTDIRTVTLLKKRPNRIDVLDKERNDDRDAKPNKQPKHVFSDNREHILELVLIPELCGDSEFSSRQ